MYDRQTEDVYVIQDGQKEVIESVVAWNNMGWTYNCLGEYSKAIHACDTAIELNPNFVNPYNHLGFTYYKSRQIKKGIKLIENYEESFNACYKCLKVDERFKEGLTLLRDLINNRELIDISLNHNRSDQEISEPFFKLMSWLGKKHPDNDVKIIIIPPFTYFKFILNIIANTTSLKRTIIESFHNGNPYEKFKYNLKESEFLGLLNRKTGTVRLNIDGHSMISDIILKSLMNTVQGHSLPSKNLNAFKSCS